MNKYHPRIEDEDALAFTVNHYGEDIEAFKERIEKGEDLKKVLTECFTQAWWESFHNH